MRKKQNTDTSMDNKEPNLFETQEEQKKAEASKEILEAELCRQNGDPVYTQKELAAILEKQLHSTDHPKL